MLACSFTTCIHNRRYQRLLLIDHFLLRGGDNFTFKGYFDDTGVIHMRQTPDLNNTICPICLRRGKDTKDCLACQINFSVVETHFVMPH